MTTIKRPRLGPFALLLVLAPGCSLVHSRQSVSPERPSRWARAREALAPRRAKPPVVQLRVEDAPDRPTAVVDAPATPIDLGPGKG